MNPSKIPFLFACFPPNTQMSKQFIDQSLQNFNQRITNIQYENDWSYRVSFESKSDMDIVQKETKGMIKLDSGGFITLLTEDWFYDHIKHENQILSKRNKFDGDFSQFNHSNPLNLSIFESTTSFEDKIGLLPWKVIELPMPMPKMDSLLGRSIHRSSGENPHPSSPDWSPWNGHTFEANKNDNDNTK